MILLGGNKQLDVQMAFTEIVARTQGRYGRPAHFQRRFIEVVLPEAIGIAVVALIIVRKMPRPTRLAMVALTLLAAFVFPPHFASQSRLDPGARWLGIRGNWISGGSASF